MGFRFAIILVTAVLLAVPAAAHAETVLAVYLGLAWAEDGTLRYTAPGGTDVRMDPTQWKTRSLTGPMYYGVRLTRWLPGRPGAGIALDFTHAKVYLDTTANAHVTGTRGGAPVDTVEPVSNTLSHFNNSHGLNLLTLNALWRGDPPRPGDPKRGVTRPYAGFGLGVSIPHVEAQTALGDTFHYKYSGPAAQVLAGVSRTTAAGWEFFGEYKFSRSWLDEPLSGGDRVRLNANVHHLLMGVGR